MIILRATPKKTIQSNALKDINKSKWNSKKCLSNPHEGKKKKEMRDKT